jgi:uncharacterized integral membrane protein
MTSTSSGTTPDPVEPSPTTPVVPTGPTTQTRGQRKADDPLRASRTSGFYTGVIVLGVVLVLLIIFIAQNTESSSIQFLVWEGTAPQAVLLLIATAAGIFLTAVASSLRLLQVKRRVKRERKR